MPCFLDGNTVPGRKYCGPLVFIYYSFMSGTLSISVGSTLSLYPGILEIVSVEPTQEVKGLPIDNILSKETRIENTLLTR